MYDIKIDPKMSFRADPRHSFGILRLSLSAILCLWPLQYWTLRRSAVRPLRGRSLNSRAITRPVVFLEEEYLRQARMMDSPKVLVLLQLLLAHVTFAAPPANVCSKNKTLNSTATPFCSSYLGIPTVTATNVQLVTQTSLSTVDLIRQVPALHH